MKSGNKWWKVIAAVLILTATGTAGFFSGRMEAEKKHAAERELNILLNRSEWDGMKPIEGPVYVTGHKAPDTDTVASAIACADILNQLGYDARPVVLGPVNKETEYVLEQAGLQTPELLTDASGLNMVLVDHSDYAQSADGLEDAVILSIIDHHGDGTVTSGSQMIFDGRPLGSAATILWIKYRNYGLEIDQKTAAVMLGAVLSDTINLLPGAFTPADAEAVKELSRISGITDTDAFFQEMFRRKTSHEGMTDEEIFMADYKQYEAGSTTYGIGVIDVSTEAEAKEMADRMAAFIPQELAASGVDMLFAQISAMGEVRRATYIVCSDPAAAEVIQTAYVDTGRGTFDGTSYVIRPSISRKKDLVPNIEQVLEMHPKE